VGLGKFFPARESLVSDISAGDGITAKPFFYSVTGCDRLGSFFKSFLASFACAPPTSVDFLLFVSLSEKKVKKLQIFSAGGIGSNHQAPFHQRYTAKKVIVHILTWIDGAE